jgi:glycosyltransferase involved in cell wall biosynthesis
MTPVGLGSDVRALLSGFPIDEAAIDVLTAGGNPIAGKTAALAAVLWKLKPAAVMAQLDTPNILAGIAALIAGVPRVVLSFRNYNPSRFSYLNNDWYLDCYRILSRSPRVVLTGNSTLGNEDYARWIGIDSNSVLLVPNAMDGNMVKPAASAKADLRRKLGISAEAPVIVGVFRLSEEKRPSLFLDVCERVSRKIPGVRAFIVGTGELEKAVQTEINRRRLEGVVTLLGTRKDVPELLSSASVLLHTSILEGMPNAVMEAQALGVPVVATRVGGTPDCVEDGVTGHIAAPDDLDGLVCGVVRVLNHADVAWQMSCKASARTSRWFTHQQMAAAMLEAAGIREDARGPNPNDSLGSMAGHQVVPAPGLATAG